MTRALSIFTALSLTIALVVTANPARATAEPRVVATITVGSAPWGVAFTPDGSRAFVGNSGSTYVSVIDVAARSQSTTVSTGSVANPAGIAVTPDGSKVLVTGFGGSPYTISSIATSSLAVTTQSVDCVNPLPITVRTDGTDAYIGCGDGRLRGISVATLTDSPIRTDTGTIDAVAYVPRGSSASDDIAYLLNSGGTGAFRLSNAGTVGALPAFGRSVAVDATGAWAYVGDSAGTISVFSIAAPTAANHTITVGGDLRGIALSPNGDRAYVTDNTGDTVKIVDLALRTVIATIPVGSDPQNIAISPDGRTALVTNNSSSSVSVIAIPAPRAYGDLIPTAYLQQFAISADGTCDSAPADLADFPGLGARLHNSAWGMSWALWPNGGTGGFVCSRQPYFTAAQDWAVE